MRYTEWVQEALLVTFTMFCRVWLAKNLEKIKAIMCKPGFIWLQLGEEAYNRQVTGEEATFRERKRTRVGCAECGYLVAAYSFRHCM